MNSYNNSNYRDLYKYHTNEIIGKGTWRKNSKESNRVQFVTVFSILKPSHFPPLLALHATTNSTLLVFTLGLKTVERANVLFANNLFSVKIVYRFPLLINGKEKWKLEDWKSGEMDKWRNKNLVVNTIATFMDSCLLG